MATSTALVAAGVMPLSYQGSHQGLLSNNRVFLSPAKLSLRRSSSVFKSSKTTVSRIVSPVASTAEFALKEASKFHDDLAEELGKYDNLADVKGRIAETCAKVLQDYVSTFSGTVSSQPIEKMKAALRDQGLPTEKPLCCAIWWLRANLSRDWNQWKASQN